MEKAKSVWLSNKFDVVWESLSKIENGVELETGEYKTKFIAKAVMAKRAGKAVEALVFLKSTDDGKLKKECSRCYPDDWGFYFNHLGIEGQRIGMYCLSLDCYFNEKASKEEMD